MEFMLSTMYVPYNQLFISVEGIFLGCEAYNGGLSGLCKSDYMFIDAFLS